METKAIKYGAKKLAYILRQIKSKLFVNIKNRVEP